VSSDDRLEEPASTAGSAAPADATSSLGDPGAEMAEIAMQARRAVVPAVVIGVVALVASFVLGQPLAGIGVCIGLGVGMANARVLQRSVQSRFEIIADAPGTKTHFLSSGAVRLAVLTLGTILTVWLVRPLGFGILIGLAIFQVVMIGFAAVAMYKTVRA